jgi:hypothetical protein
MVRHSVRHPFCDAALVGIKATAYSLTPPSEQFSPNGAVSRAASIVFVRSPEDTLYSARRRASDARTPRLQPKLSTVARAMHHKVFAIYGNAASSHLAVRCLSMRSTLIWGDVKLHHGILPPLGARPARCT